MGRIAIPRRRFLQGLSATGLVGASGCKPGDSDVAVTPGKIDTIVLCMMENRSFDHMLGSLSLVEGRTDLDGLTADHYNPDTDGTPVAPWPLSQPCTYPDPPHGWDSSHTALNGGDNLGFIKSFVASRGAQGRENVMSYHQRVNLPVYYAISDYYAVANRWFSSVCGPTWPNRLYFHGAQSQGMKTNDFPPGEHAFSMRTIWDQLDEAGIRWGNYFTDLPTIAMFGRFHDGVYTIADFFVHAAAGTLPPVVMLDPGAASNDDHPPHHTMLGQLFISTIHNALATSPQWNRTLFVVVYDEAGGIFDHVVPGLAADDRASEGFDQLGFRVPALAMGPWVRERFVSDVEMDHTSALKHIHLAHDLDDLTARDAAANDLSSFLDLDRMARNDPRPPADLPVIELTPDEINAQCAADRSRRTSSQPELRAHVRRFAPHLDRTDQMDEIDAFLLDKAVELGACLPK